MKIQFDPNLEYQQEAIKSVTDIFEGQEVCTSNFSVPSFDNDGLYNNETELGYGNKLHLLDDEIVENNIPYYEHKMGLKRQNIIKDKYNEIQGKLSAHNI